MSNIYISDVLQEIRSGSEWVLKNENLSTIRWLKDSTDGKGIPTEKEVEDKRLVMQAEYDAQEYARKRQAEYPSIEELVVALYDLDDKSAIEAKRAEVKAKYPKPE